MRRLSPIRRPSWPAIAWAAGLVLSLALAVGLAMGSDAANTDVRTTTAPPESRSVALPAELRPLWTSDAAVDDQRVVAGDTVITSTRRGVRGLDPATGAERWHYLRYTATMCDVAVLDDVVVAIFRTRGRCNEAVALDAGSGVRRWYRNVGFSDQLTLLGSGTAVVAITPGGIAVLDAVGSSIRWRYNPPEGCELSSTGVGSTGVVIVERCTTGTTWLALFDLYSGKQLWRVPPPSGEVTIVGADGAVTLLAGQRLLILRPRDGATSTVLAAPVGDAQAAVVGRSGAPGVALLLLDGVLSAIDPATGRQVWSVPATGLPATNDLGVVVPEGGALVTRSLSTGAELGRSVFVEESGAQGPVWIARAGSVVIAVTEQGIAAYG